MEVDAAFLEGVSEMDYKHMQSVLVQSKQTLWITRAEPSRGTDPGRHLADGLGRTLMSEDSARKFVTLSLDELELDLNIVGGVICELAQRIILSPAVEAVENNYIIDKGVLQVCRVSGNVAMDKTVLRAVLPRQTQEDKITADTQVALRLAPGHLDTLEWFESEEREGGEVDDEIEADSHQEFQADEVVVKVRAIGLTLRDHLIARGQLNELIVGTDCAGVVQKSGSETGFKTGDRVCLISTSTARSTIRVKASAVTNIPSHMSFAEAASMPSSMWVSYHAIVNLASVQEGEVVLIYQGASCISQLAIQLAQSRGARILLTASSAAKAKFLCAEFRIPETDIFYDNDPAILSKIYQSTEWQGVDVIFGALSNNGNGNGRGVELSTCLAPFGRLVETSLSTPAHTLLDHLGSDSLVNVSRSSINMVELLRKRPTLAHRIFQRAMKCAFDKHLRPAQPLHSFAAGEVKAAFSHFVDHADLVGKRIIELEEDMAIKVNIKTKPTYNFSKDATYVIGGGLGGLGRSFARWMVRRGARHLILLSRSGPKSDATKDLIVELEAQRVYVATPGSRHWQSFGAQESL
ncbi:Lovastatin diketide synthase LovF [Cytospora mali]|uniref:Lovastatin diketide synthase LovF n=1 Tax=Cytospora mali TaxID=578113 RepID=A0A194VM22_CYTMA|nr:Lovastatin diketide synthase LovF [Valsa mali]